MSKDQAPGQHKLIDIIVNGTIVEVEERELTFSQIAKLAFPELPPNENTIYTIGYSRAQGNKPEGTLVEGETLKLKEGMILNVAHTDKS